MEALVPIDLRENLCLRNLRTRYQNSYIKYFQPSNIFPCKKHVFIFSVQNDDPGGIFVTSCSGICGFNPRQSQTKGFSIESHGFPAKYAAY